MAGADPKSRAYYPRCRAVLHVILDGLGSPDEDSDELVFAVLPKSATVHRNKYSQADSFELTFDADDLPFDPELIRAGAADVYLYQVRGAQEDDTVLSRQFAATSQGGELARTVSEAVGLDMGLLTEPWVTQHRPIVGGLFDEPKLSLGKDGRWVTISGQDYTAYLAGRQWPPTPAGHAQRIPVGMRLDVLLREILSRADPKHKLRLDPRGLTVDQMPVVKPEINAHARGIPVEQNTTYWDVMYKLALRYGYILFVDGLDVVLTQPQNVDKDTKIYRFRWGANVESLELSRRMGKETCPTIVVSGIGPNGKTVTVEYPPGSRHFNSVNERQKSADVHKGHSTTKFKSAPPKPRSLGKHTTTVHQKDEYEFIPVGRWGGGDPATLLRMAETRFRLRGRGERKVVLKTKDLADLADADLLGLGAGSAVAIEFDDFNATFLGGSAPTDAKVGHLLARGYNPTVAQTVVRYYERLLMFRRPLRVREVSYTFGSGDGEGISLEMELVDFVVVDDQRTFDEHDAALRREEKLRRPDGSRVGYGAGKKEEAGLLRRADEFAGGGE